MSHSKKRGQRANAHILYFIFLIVTGFIIIFGYKIISGMVNIKDEAGMIDLKNKLERSIKSVGVGDVQSFSMSQSNFDEICFVDTNRVNPTVDPDDIREHPLIQNSVKSKSKANLFFIKKNEIESFYIPDLYLSYPPYWACIKPNQLTPKSRDILLEGTAEGAEADVISLKYCKNAQDNPDFPNCGLLDPDPSDPDDPFKGYKEKCCKKTGYCCPIN